MMNLIGKWTRRTDSKLTRRVHNLEMEIEARDRTIRVLQAEIDSLAGVVARDRLRVQAETAEYARRKAEAESNGHGSQ